MERRIINTEFIYDHISHFDQGIASVKKENKAYFIDRSGNRARGLPIVENADSVSLVGQLVRVLKNTRIAYIDRKES
ncbi:WG repeat-containing protein [Anaerobacillus sp. HL2]|nr:WG repeat-containing protein [Anaerobacillus sp. HL2]